MFLYASAGFAQDETATTTPSAGADVEETAPESEAVPAGQEVEINEDNYRQFMELKDARQQRNMLPENSYQSQAGAQKIDKLPEESQKHLRNELREIIIQGDQWQPGDENTDYPYAPSNAASTNRALQKQEADAWGELVDNYHKREAEIYGNASRSKAASATAGAAGTITLAATASTTEDFYKDQKVHIVSGTGAGQGRLIEDNKRFFSLV